MRIEELRPAPGSRKNKKRVGRGPGSGRGKTSTRGEKGQKARSGGGKGPGFEGGQMPLIRRLPKRGFTNIFREPFAVVNVATLEALAVDDTITVDMLHERGLIRKSAKRVKVLGEGDLGRAVKVRVHAVSASARAKIEAAGGSVDLI
ncbi:MAG: 50S ribosomal protein L15 [Nitrospirae bacterium]|nr:50S ribosomal protein L15 [Nitrospirota bacterium]